MSERQSKKILVTGGAGFIGSHVAEALLDEGFAVHIVDNLSSGNEGNVPKGCVFHEMDIRSRDVRLLWEREKFDTLVHHAAQMDVRRSVADPAFDADVNVHGFLNLAESGKSAGLRKIVFASTGGAIYGDPAYTPQDEDHPLRPVSPYGITKLCTEKYLDYYKIQFGIDYVSLRYANVYGPRQNPHGEAGVVAIFAQRMLEGEEAFINGDGLQTRDYVFVGDVVRMNVNAVRASESGVYNVGTGKETTVVELFGIVNAHTGGETKQQHKPAKPGEQRRSVLSHDKATQKFGWTPDVDLEEGLRRTVNWFRNRG